jgi:probable F420-dependent oxidoreductase
VQARRRQHRVPETLHIQMGVDVHEAGRHNSTVGVDCAPGRANVGTDGGDALAVDGDVGGDPRSACPIDHLPIRDHEIVHVSPPFHEEEIQINHTTIWFTGGMLRFAITAPRLSSLGAWQDELRRIEGAGFDTVVVADHFTEGWDVEPMVALTAAAMATSRLRLQTGVLGNDYRHPVLVQRMAATLDVVSEGRFTLGLGAGWLHSDYEASGIPLDPAGVRITRLEEAVGVIKALFGPDPVYHQGMHYRINGLTGVPAPVQRPHPPVLLGGGSPRVLRLAGREADIVSIVASLRAGALGAGSVADLADDRVAEKLGWVHEGVVSAGRAPADVGFSINHWLVRVTAHESDADVFLGKVAAKHGVDPGVLRCSPAVLVGTIDHLVDVLEERRERFGFSHLQLDAGFPAADIRALFPLVDRLGR